MSAFCRAAKQVSLSLFSITKGGYPKRIKVEFSSERAMRPLPSSNKDGTVMQLH